jgi:ComF family protein
MHKQPQLKSIQTSSSRRVASFAFFQLQQLGSAVLDLLYPPVCAGCQRVGQVFCEHCQHTIISARTDNPLPGVLEGFSTLGSHTGPLRQAIHALKYEEEQRVGQALGQLLAAQPVVQQSPVELVIPIPLHPDRLQQRGYNQAERIAHTVARHLELTLLAEAIHKIKSTTSQVDLNPIERQTNVQDAFAISSAQSDLLKEKNVLLIDDVCTTGATLRACAVVLKEYDVNAVFAATASRALPADDSRYRDIISR